MDPAEIIESIKECLQEVLDDEGTVERNTELLPMGIDSMSFIRLIVLLEEKFGIEIDDDDILLDNFSSIDNMEKLISKYMAT